MYKNLNATERGILNATGDDAELGPLLTAALDNQTSLALTVITPDYGDSPAPSASIPFAGNAVWLHLAEDTPFADNICCKCSNTASRDDE